ncbi:TonB-linked SusC/RagA family outer membrane protein [Catalinimonas alkaloidigena]|uniref:SusC/RagA family TonB-linked outer membrane protein n=1 Tax=Catalinimonas alkaloidigena TaxID=1075417 RepID=UPI0024060931|nr:TonB-dependent receptor [Catalinimonas alkaloidigena]MDF9797775.1 TonB-linked SusC/RagA family outer membrane protein [Catalinimonas alkaloidigena]
MYYNVLSVAKFLLFLLLCGVSVIPSLAQQPLASVRSVANTHAQDDKTMSLDQVLEKIKAQHQVTFGYQEDLVAGKAVNTQRWKKQELKQALETVLKPHGLEFKQLDEVHFVITPKENKLPKKILPKEVGADDNQYVPNKVSMLTSLDPLSVQEHMRLAQTISGQVTDGESGEPLPGVNVLAKGTTTGTVTGVDGNYRLTVADDITTLVFSSIGYMSQEVEINGRSTIDINMSPDIQSLEEIVVVGYGTQKAKDVTGAIARADMDAISEQPNVSVMEGLQGTVPGLNVSQVNQAGQNPSISIRGQTSLSGEQAPLIVVDQVIYRGALIDINPNDIKSVDVLKDASATAIYGSQAANGVIMITTKSGGAAGGKPVISYSGQYSFQQPHYELRAQTNPDRFMEKIAHSDIFQSRTEVSGYLEPNPDWTETTNFKTSHEIRQFNLGRSFDWYDYVTNDNPYTTTHNVSIANSTEYNNYFTSIGYTRQDGHLIDEYYERINGRINLGSAITDWLDVDVQSFISLSDYGPQTFGLADRYLEPFAHPYDEDGQLVDRPTGNPVNPIIEAGADVEDKRLNINANLTGTVQLPVEGLNYKLRFGNNYQTIDNNYFGAHGSSFQGYGYKRHDKEYTWSLDNILSYSKIFNNGHEIDVTLLYGVEERALSFTNAEGSNFAKDVLGFNRLQAAAADQQRVTSGGWKESSLYNMGRISYKLLDRYLITGTIRRDGFSGFSEKNKFGTFPSLAVGWVISEESFMHSLSDWVSFLKLRASYGTTGNRTIGRYQTLAEVSGGPGYVTADGSPLFTQWISALESPDLRWEKTTGVNLGVDFSVNNGRLKGSINYYNNNTTDLLYEVDIPGVSRFEIFPDNLGEIHNEGIELSLSSVNIQRNNFTWTTDFNFSSNRNRINTLLGFDVDGDGEEDDLVSEGLFIGQSTGVIYDYQIDGIWQVDDEIPNGYEFGAYRVVDLNDDNAIDGNDRKIIGNRLPAYRFGINNVLNYEKFTFRLFINSVQGGKDRYLGEESFYDFQIYNQENHFNITFPEGIDYWTPENPGAKYQRPGIKGSGGIAGTRYSPRSFVRLRNVSLSYNLGSVEWASIQDVKITLSGRNLLTITDWEGWDPETGQGITRTGRPVMESYSLGINVTF